MHNSIRILYDEHRSIAAVLHGLLALVRAAKDPAVQPEFPVFNAMIYYIDTFPERLHHPKEDQFLFARLAERAPEAHPLIDELRAEHVKGASLIRELQAALLAFEVNGQRALPAFAAAAEAYAQFHWEHMRKEENQLLPLAEGALTEADWKVIDEAFAGNEDPISDLREKDFRTLYQRIVSLAPEPIGLGARWKKSG
ncbi:MAG: hemerythrin domain-containing protein [Pseudomonadota bacterium]